MKERIVATSCDSEGWENMLVPFIASLKENAGWIGKILVIDLGLSVEQRDLLIENGIEVFKTKQIYSGIVCHRFDSLKEYAKTHDNCIIAHWDADVWFTKNIDDVFNFKDNKLKCTVDCCRQDFVTGVIFDKQKINKVSGILDSIEKINKGKILQVGFICGTSNAIVDFSNFQDLLIGLEIACDKYGTDTLALNLYYYFFRDRIEVVGIEYNCLPDWGITQISSKFYANGKEISVIHQTSPYRSVLKLSYRNLFSPSFNRWWEKMRTENIYQTVDVNGINYKIRKQPYWDHTILYHAHNEYNLPESLNGPVLDIGSHVGGFSKRVEKQFPGIKVYCFEPNFENYQLLLSNVEGIKNIKPYNVAVGGFNAKGNLHSPDQINSGMNRLILEENGKVVVLSINTILESIVKEDRIAFLKIDCEGSEWDIFKYITDDNLQRIDEIQGEIHTDICNIDNGIEFLKNKLRNFNVSFNGNLLTAKHE